MARVLFIALALASILIVSGCTTTGQLTGQPERVVYQCADGSTVEDISSCPPASNVAKPETIKEPLCKPNYINAGSDFSTNAIIMNKVDACKKTCFDRYEVVSYNLEDDVCSCDVNNCGDTVIGSYCGDENCSSKESFSACPDDCKLFELQEAYSDGEAYWQQRDEISRIGKNEFKIVSTKEEEWKRGYHTIYIPVVFYEEAEGVAYDFTCSGPDFRVSSIGMDSNEHWKRINSVDIPLCISSRFTYDDNTEFDAYINHVEKGDRVIIFVHFDFQDCLPEAGVTFSCEFDVVSTKPYNRENTKIVITTV